MKIITKIEQLIPGAKVNIYHKTGELLVNEIFVQYVNNSDVKIFGLMFPYNFSSFIFELVSYPERRKLTWEYAKSKVDEWPLTVWDGDLQDQLLFANSNDFNCSYFYYKWPKDNFFIDPPHPEVEDITPPWIAVQAAEEDPWVEITPTTKVKLPCEALVKDSNTEKWFKLPLTRIKQSDIRIKQSELLPFKTSQLHWKYAKVRKSSIIQEPTQPTEPDDKVKRLWWYKLNTGAIWSTPYALTEKEFIRGNHFSYAPGPIVPDELEWKEVK